MITEADEKIINVYTKYQATEEIMEEDALNDSTISNTRVAPIHENGKCAMDKSLKKPQHSKTISTGANSAFEKIEPNKGILLLEYSYALP
jgi:hypothetical protein